MENIKEKAILNHLTLGEAAVDGLLAGVIAGLAMAITLLVASLVYGRSLMEAQSLISVGVTAEPTLGLLSHLAVSGVYGIVFGLMDYLILGKWLKQVSLGSSALLGLIYGVILWFIAVFFLLPGSISPMQSLPMSLLLIAHLVYGLVLGLLEGRQRKR